MEGKFYINNIEYEFIIKEDMLCFETENTMQWRIEAEKKSFRMELEVPGITNDGQQVIILTKQLRKIEKKNVVLSIEAVFIYNGAIDFVKGIQVSYFDEISGEGLSVTTYKDNRRVKDEITFYECEKNGFILKSDRELRFSETLNLAYDSINVLRFIIQSNNIGYVKIYLIGEDERIGYIDYCKNITSYCGRSSEPKLTNIYKQLETNIPDILTAMMEKKIYMAHIGDEPNHKVITPGIFVTILAGFEWECRNIDIGSLSENAIKAKNYLLEKLEDIIAEAKGKKIKKHLNSYKKLIHNMNLTLGVKLERIFEKYDDYVKPIATPRYNINKIEMNYKHISERLQNQRNDFAHGNLNKPIEWKSAIDVQVLRMLLFIIQLDKYGVPEQIIKKCFEDVFEDEVFTKYDTDIKIAEYLKCFLDR